MMFALRHELEHQVAPDSGAIRMPPGVVIRGPANNRHQQRHFRQVQLRQRLAEIKLAGQPEAVNGAVAVLAQEDLIDVGVHEIGLAEVRLERQGHGGFAQLALRGAAGVEEVTLDELLGQRTASLLDLTRAHVDPHRTRNAHRVDAMMGVEVTVLDCLQGGRQQRRHLLWRDNDAIFAVDRENAADQLRLETDNRHILAGTVMQGSRCRSRSTATVRMEAGRVSSAKVAGRSAISIRLPCSR